MFYNIFKYDFQIFDTVFFNLILKLDFIVFDTNRQHLMAMVFFFSTVLSIRCYMCGGKDCDTVFNCTANIGDACMYSKVGDRYARSCINKKNCDQAADACKQAGNCVISCCQKDLCNKDGASMATTKPPTTGMASISKPVTVIAFMIPLLTSFLSFL